jgi:hypothetical protein
MSLINDALKKAQRDRSGENPAAQPPPSAPPPTSPAPAAPAAATSGFKGMQLIAAAAIIVVGIVAWLMFAPSKAPETVAAAEAPAVTTPAPVAAQPAEVAPVESKTEPATGTSGSEVAPQAPVIDAPVVEAPPSAVAQTQPEPPPAVAVKIDEAPAVVVNIPSATTPSAASTQELPATVITIPEGPAGSSPATQLVTVRQQDPRILAYLDALRVNGIRPSPDDPKALVNNRVFRIGDIVDRELNLRLTGIAPAKLTFEDERGMIYLKSF